MELQHVRVMISNLFTKILQVAFVPISLLLKIAAATLSKEKLCKTLLLKDV